MGKCDFNKLLCNFIEIVLQHGFSPVNLLHIFRTPFPKKIVRKLHASFSTSIRQIKPEIKIYKFIFILFKVLFYN